MQHVTDTAAARTPSPRSRVAPVAAGVLALAAVAAAYGVGRSSGITLRVPPASSDAVEVRPSPSVITAVRDLHRLECESFHMERVVEATDEQSRLFGLVDAKDAVLLVAVGDVVAGVDLDAMKDGDVSVDWPARTARVRLPAPQVFAATLDNARTHVYQRSTDVLAARKESLEGIARQDAESSMKQAAIDGGILERARASAGRAVEGLVRGLGFREVIVEWQVSGAAGAPPAR
jgi:hypothetical protein